MGLIIALGRNGGVGRKVTEATHAYGVQWDATNSSPSCIRIGNLGLHASLPVHSQMRGCLLLDNGTINYYLKADDWSKKADGTPSDLSGADGQVMVRMPQHYRKFETDGNVRRVMISEYELTGYHLVPEMFISAYEATVQRSVSKLASVVNFAADYRGGNNNAAWDASHSIALQDGSSVPANPSPGDTIVFNSTTFTFVAALTDPAVAGEVLIGGTPTDTMANFVSVFNDLITGFLAVPAGTPNNTCSIQSSSTNQGTLTVSGTNIVVTSTTRSLLGRPASLISRTNFRTYARNRAAGTKWNLYTYDAHKALTWLFVIEYATRNSQLAVNNALTAEGYRQGGLGNGVSTANSTEWSNFNGYYPFVPCGYTDSLANGSGEVEISVANFGGAGIARAFMANRYRGIEHPFGHIWKNSDGVNVKIQAADAGGESQLWVSENPADFSDSVYTNYENRGLIARGNGYVGNVVFGDKGELLPSTTQASSTLYWCDYFYTSIPASGESLRTLYWGGFASYGADDGLAYASSNNVPATTLSYVGSRLCFLP